jgi:hypothetical protein
LVGNALEKQWVPWSFRYCISTWKTYRDGALHRGSPNCVAIAAEVGRSASGSGVRTPAWPHSFARLVVPMPHRQRTTEHWRLLTRKPEPAESESPGVTLCDSSLVTNRKVSSTSLLSREIYRHRRASGTSFSKELSRSFDMREIPELHVLCLRVVGSHSCSAEVTFSKHPDTGEPSLASRLLRSFHERGSNIRAEERDEGSSLAPDSLKNLPISPRPCIGPGSARRLNANEVDLNHPIIGCRMPTTDPDASIRFQPLIMQYGNPALDVLQSYIDTLVDLGRMDDTRLGIHFFNEWKTNVVLAASFNATTASAPQPTKAVTTTATSKKRRRSGGRSASASPAPAGPTLPAAAATAVPVLPMGSLSLHNCSIADDTVNAMVESGMGRHLAVLDLSGIRGLTDALVTKILLESPNMERLSLKNCRKITGSTARQLVALPRLQFLDVGGCFNIAAHDVLDAIPNLPLLDELHASGLLWNDATLSALVKLRDTWKGLSLGFSLEITPTVLRESLLQLGDSLQSLALPFCETIVDNALLGLLGRNMPLLQFLDLRGNPSLNTVTGFYDGRASAYLPAQALTILARYSGITENSVEETRRVHPLHTAGNLLTIYLDEKGMGAGILRTMPGASESAEQSQ